jgi:hypothetical protein
MSRVRVAAPDKVSTSKGRNVAILVVAIVAIAIGAFGVLALSSGGVGNISIDPKDVTVSGNATASGQGTLVSQIIFTDTSGNQFAAAVSYGQYSIEIPNHANYTITGTWNGRYSWQTGSIILTNNQLPINQGFGASSSLTENIEAQTPNSIIILSGIVNTNGIGTQPTAIRFTDSNGQLYTADVVGGAYSLQLPNLMTYTVQVQWSGLLSSSGTCNADSATVNASVGVTSASINASC